MHKFLILIYCLLMISSVTMAEEDTTPETCANGAGTVFVGKVSNHKYCRSNKTMNWWNAVSWCDSIHMEPFDLNDCHWEQVTSLSNCPEATGISDGMFWTATLTQDNKRHVIEAYSGYIKYTYTPDYSWRVLCK